MERFTKSSDTLPFFVSSGSPSRRGLSFFRWWRSLPRLQRSVATVALLLTFLTLSVAVISFNFTDIRVVKTDFEKVDKDDKLAAENEVVERPPSPVKEGESELPAVHAKGEEAPDVKPEAGQQEQLVKPKFLKFTGPENEKQRAVVGAFKHAWAGYKKYAWGKDQLRPISKSFQEWFGTGLTIVDSLDTMLIFGLNEEFAESKTWVENELSFDKNVYVSLFETTIRMLGGLLSAYHLSGERIFLDKATDLGLRLAGAFESPSPVPFSDVNLRSKQGKQPSWGGDSSLSEITSIQLEFRDLSRLTGNPIFERVAFNVSQHLHKLGCAEHDGLCPMFISPQTGQWKQGVGAITFGARSDSYYEYLLKQWLQTGKTID
uniref:alpha-1,2-Mannosidase n=1 Tax=Plectus sambesii TaxID=2011161 RepID=A0A914XIA6_9BILA